MKKKWTVARAKERFSEVLREAQQGPQPIFNRDRLVAFVVESADYEAFEAWRRRQQAGSLADAFRELRELCREEDYRLETPKRVNRPNPFAKVVRDARERAR